MLNRGDSWRSTARRPWRNGQRTVSVANLIELDPVLITITRADPTKHELAPQTVRINYDSTGPFALPMGFAGSVGNVDVVILGYLNHPSIPDTDIQKGDRFSINGKRYEVEHVFSLFDDRVTAVAKESS